MSNARWPAYTPEEEMILADVNLTHSEAAALIGRGKTNEQIGEARRDRGIRALRRSRPEDAKNWTPEMHAVLREMAAAGVYRGDIIVAMAERFGVKRSDGAIYEQCRALGIKPPPKSPEYSPEPVATPSATEKADEIFANVFRGQDVPVRPSRRTFYAPIPVDARGVGQWPL